MPYSEQTRTLEVTEEGHDSQLDDDTEEFEKQMDFLSKKCLGEIMMLE